MAIKLVNSSGDTTILLDGHRIVSIHIDWGRNGYILTSDLREGLEKSITLIMSRLAHVIQLREDEEQWED